MISIFRRCIHDWKLIDKTVLPSGLEQMLTAQNLSELKGSPAMAMKSVVLALSCTKCGKLVVEKRSNP